MKLTFLGTGTSTGVPQMRCNCETCTSTDPRDRRLRCSALVEVDGLRLLIDPGPDLRQQLLREGCPDIDAVLVTHTHYDHLGGVDDLRPYCKEGPFPIYCRADVARDLRNRIPYCFAEHPYPGVPSLQLVEIAENRPFTIGHVTVEPLAVNHWRLPILGYRIGPLAYITDCTTLSAETYDRLRGLDTLVVNALRHKEHNSHMNLRQALELIGRLSPRRAYLTHMSHEIGLHARIEPLLPHGVHYAYDGLTVNISNKIL